MGCKNLNHSGKKEKNILIIFGGKSGEHEVSVKSETQKSQDKLNKFKLSSESENQKVIDGINAAALKRTQANEELKTSIEKERTEIKTKSLEAAMTAIQPKLIEALIVNGNSN